MIFLLSGEKRSGMRSGPLSLLLLVYKAEAPVADRGLFVFVMRFEPTLFSGARGLPVWW